jgi:RNA polymerase sigma factor (sigma-70 family)
VEHFRSGDGQFPTTRRSAVAGASSTDPKERERSWTRLVGAYWKPAYKYARIRWRASPEDAQDQVQSFFAQAMEREFFATFEPSRARFRTFFRTCLDRHLANEDKARHRQKRGGDPRALDFDAAEEELARAGAAAWEAPEDSFDREWRRSVFERAVQALRAACEDEGKGDFFRVFERYDLSEAADRPKYEDLARELGIPLTTVTNRLAWARRELRRRVLAEVEAVTADDAELRAEGRALLGGDR